MSPSTLSPLRYQQLINLQSSRRLLQHHPLYQSLPTTTATPPPPPPPPPMTNNAVDPTEPYSGTNGFDANVVMVLSVLLCALICSLGLNSIIKCALRCSNFIPTQESNENNPSSSANTGIKKKALKSFAVVSYSPNEKLPGLGTDCVICLSDFAPGDKLRLLPNCQHGFHIRCIDKWLNTHSSCPTCRHCLIETCQKIVGCDQPGSSQPLQESIIDMVPLQREDLVRGFRDSF